MDLWAMFEKELFESNNSLSESDMCTLENEIDSIENQIDALEKKKFLLGRLKNLNCLKNKGVSNEELIQYKKEDDEIIAKAEQYKDNHFKKKEYMFGFPANMSEDSPTVKYLKHIEKDLSLMNNCGDTFQEGKHYAMSNKKIEIELLEVFAKHLGMDIKDIWGYVTSGGTESNYWAINEGFNRFKNEKPVLYFSEASHYSIPKFAEIIGKPYDKIRALKSDAIDLKELQQKVLKNWKQNKSPAVLALTWGTTKMGAIDDVEIIKSFLNKNKVPHYMHIDAALYGGIPNNQTNAPCIKNFKDTGANSISISLHKYLGLPSTNGIIISNEKVNRKYIDYIGQEDNTFLGSRCFKPFSSLQKCKEVLQRSSPSDYENILNYFLEKANARDIKYNRINNGNIITTDKPNEDVCSKYQLSTFKSGKKEKAHVVIFPAHSKKAIDSLIDDLTV